MTPKDNKDLQTRIEFFRNAVKAVLPIIGVVVLSGIPRVVKAAENPVMGCKYASCIAMCSENCSRQCHGSCRTSCHGDSCSNQCKRYCSYACSANCQSSCVGGSK